MSFVGKTMGKTKAEKKERQYVLRQYILKENLVGVDAMQADMNTLEDIINSQCERGYAVCQMNSVAISSKGGGGGDRTLILILFEKTDDDSESDSD